MECTDERLSRYAFFKLNIIQLMEILGSVLFIFVFFLASSSSRLCCSKIFPYYFKLQSLLCEILVLHRSLELPEIHLIIHVKV